MTIIIYTTEHDIIIVKQVIVVNKVAHQNKNKNILNSNSYFQQEYFYLIDQNKHKSIFVINQLLDLLKHLCDKLAAL